MPFKNGNKLCICEICVCGRHHCPHKVRVSGPYGECTLSEYNNKYVPHQLIPVQSMKPAPTAARGDGVMADETTNRVDYTPKAMERPYIHQAELYKRPDGEFEGTTMYNKDYTEKRAERLPPTRHEGGKKVLGDFEGNPTYKSDYIKWEMPRINRPGGNQIWCPPQTNFEGTPTYVSDYIAHRLNPVKSLKPDGRAALSDAPFSGITDYRQSYVPHALQSRIQPEQKAYLRPNVPFEGITTFQRDFTKKEGGRMGSYKPANAAYNSGQPLASDTTNRMDYVEWHLTKPHLHEADAYKVPEGDMDMGTTYERDYRKFGLSKPDALKRADRKLDSGEFFDNTEYKDYFKQWEVGKRANVGPNQQYFRPEVPFEGQSTFTAHYVKKPLAFRESFKPKNKADTNVGAFDGTTMYRTEYVPKEVEPCPAIPFILDSERDFVYKEQDQVGHKYYQPIHTTVKDLRTGDVCSSANRVPVPAN